MARSARNIREVVEVDLGANLTRIFDDDDGTRVDAAHIDCWRSACRLLSTQSFEHKGNSVKLTTNWAPVLERVKDDTKNNRIFNHKREIAETANFDRSTVKMRFTVHTIISNPRERQGRPE